MQAKFLRNVVEGKGHYWLGDQKDRVTDVPGTGSIIITGLH